MVFLLGNSGVCSGVRYRPIKAILQIEVEDYSTDSDTVYSVCRVCHVCILTIPDP